MSIRVVGSSLFDLASALPDHMADAAIACSDLRDLPHPSDVDAVVILGMGSARTAGQVVRAVGGPTMPIPILVESSYELPAWVGKRTLAFALSGSGNTDEVNHAVATAAARGARIAIVTAGGWLADFAHDCDAVLVQIPTAIAPARATFGVLVASLLTMLERSGFLPDAGMWINAAIAQLRRRRDSLRNAENPPMQLARHLAGRHVALQGDSPIGAVAAERWKAQINQNARQPASFSEQPNASHNEAVGWDFHPVDTSQNEAVVLLRHGLEDPRVSRRMDLLGAYLHGKVPIHSVSGEGGTPLAVLMDLTMIGDFTSLYMAELNAIDPAAIPFISDTLKKDLVPPDHGRRTSDARGKT